MSKNKEKEMQIDDDSTKYAEFISSYFAWLPLKKQKNRANELENMTKNEK